MQITTLVRRFIFVFLRYLFAGDLFVTFCDFDTVAFFVCLSVWLCVCLLVSVATTGTCASDERVVIMRVSVSICLCVCLYVCLCTTRCGVVCVCLCVCLSVCLYVSLCVCICLCVSVGVSVLLDSGRVYFCICLSFCLSVYVYEVLEVLVAVVQSI